MGYFFIDNKKILKLETIKKRFDELSLDELYLILHSRQEVFTVEQNIVYQDLDNLDQQSVHLFIKEDDKMVAYLRIIDAGAKFQETSIGRVLTTKEYRGMGYGRKIMLDALDFLKEIKGFPINIYAQEYLVRFYESLGFEKRSEPFILEGISHVEMIHP